MEQQLHHLRAIRAISRSKSLHKAAAQLGVSQPALSAQLRRIEHTLGGQLFERSPHGMRATPYGESVSYQALAVLDAMEEIRAGVVASRNPHIRIGCLTGLLTPTLRHALSECLASEEVVFRLEASVTSLHDLVAAGRLDVAAAIACSDDPLRLADAVAGMRLGDVTPLLLLPPTHRLAGYDRVELSDLTAERWAVPMVGGDDWTRCLRRTCAHAGFTPTVHYRPGDHHELTALVAAGPAIAVCPGPLDIATALVVARPLDGVTLDASFELLWNTSAMTAGEIQRCAQVFQARYGALTPVAA